MLKRNRFWFVLVLLTFVKASTFVGSVITYLPMNVPRAGHTTTLLQDGNVLITGGCIAQGCDNRLTDSAELYDSVNQQFIKTGSMNVARVGHQAISLSSGKVLILGGWAGDGATANRIYNPETGRFERAGEMLEPRDGFTATLLQDGKILITGGYNGAMNRLSSAELYDPMTQTSISISAMSEPRMAHSASLLQDGRVLIVGGSKSRGQVLSSAEIFDPITQTFAKVGNLSIPRHKHAALTLDDGDVLIIGGSGAGDFDQQYNSIERFDSQTSTFRQETNLQEERFKIPNAVTLLDNGFILIAGNNSHMEVYDPLSNTSSVFQSE